MGFRSKEGRMRGAFQNERTPLRGESCALKEVNENGVAYLGFVLFTK